MELRISINEKAVFALLIVVAMVSAVGITLAQNDPGHPWSQIDCSECITSDNVDFNYAGSSSKGGKATSAATADSADSAASVPWSGITGIQACTWTNLKCVYWMSGAYYRTYYAQEICSKLCLECKNGELTDISSASKWGGNVVAPTCGTPW